MNTQATKAEIELGALPAHKLESIVELIETQGFAVVTNLISAETQSLLGDAVLSDAVKIAGGSRPTHHEKATGPGHLQLGLRRHAPYARTDLLANPIIEQIVTTILGSGAWLGFYNGNVNLPGSGYQKVHFDRPYSWRSREEAAEDGHSWPPPTTTLSCSIALTEITEANGATEIYPGSHHETEVVNWPAGDRVSNHPEILKAWQPPARMPIPAGAVCFRDPRMWHRGVPNPGETPRPMIALTYHAGSCLHWRGRLVRDPPAKDRAEIAANSNLKILDDGSLGDARLVFDADTKPMLHAAENLYGVNRNIRFIEPPARVNHLLDAHELGGARISPSSTLSPDP